MMRSALLIKIMILDHGHDHEDNLVRQLPWAKNLKGATGKLLDGWNLIGIGQRQIQLGLRISF